MNHPVNSRPRVAISSCIIGQHVRYDGEIKHFPELCQQLSQQLDLIPVCPEVEIGLSVPRPPVQLSGDPDQPQMTGRDDPGIDITDKMRHFCETRPQQLDDICGYVFKSKSPSCGLYQVPVFNRGKVIDANGRGLFAKTITQHFDQLPVVQEDELQTPQQIAHFIQQVLNYCNNR